MYLFLMRTPFYALFVVEIHHLVRWGAHTAPKSILSGHLSQHVSHGPQQSGETCKLQACFGVK